MTHPPLREQITFLSTLDLETTAHFYENLLGLELVLDQGGCRIYRVSASGYLGFCQREAVINTGQNVILTLVTEEVDTWYEYLTGRGVEAFESPRENPQYEIYHFFFKDPNGYWLEIQSFLDPNWKR